LFFFWRYRACRRFGLQAPDVPRESLVGTGYFIVIVEHFPNRQDRPALGEFSQNLIFANQNLISNLGLPLALPFPYLAFSRVASSFMFRHNDRLLANLWRL